MVQEANRRVPKSARPLLCRKLFILLGILATEDRYRRSPHSEDLRNQLRFMSDCTLGRSLSLPLRQIPGGRAEVGTDMPLLPLDVEGPRRHVKVKPFLMAETAVTNVEFLDFVADTGYRTDAERFGWSLSSTR